MTTIFHIDVNSAFLSWTALDTPVDAAHPDLRTIPSIIGGDEKTRHGIVLAKSTPAKAYGIRTAETIASALRKCPQLVVVPPSHGLYKRRSRELMDLLRGYTPKIEQVSIDECYMDFGPIAHRFPSPVSAADQIRARVRKELGFTVNVGIAPNKLLAKMASDFTKPDRTHTLFFEEIPAKLWPLPVDDLFLVGRATAGRLHALGIHTIGDLAHADPAFLEAHFKSGGRRMHDHANGIASDQVKPVREDAKGIGNSTTLPSDLTTPEEAKKVLAALSRKVAQRMESHHVLAGCVTVEIKYNDFSVNSHQTMTDPPVGGEQALTSISFRLFSELWNGGPVRLLGVRATHLKDKDAPVQMTLFEAAKAVREENARRAHDEKKARADKAAEAIRQKYGANIIRRGDPSV